MKTILILILAAFSTLTFADDKIDFSCNGGGSVTGSRMTVYAPGWFSRGSVEYKNPLPSQYDMTGKEETLTTETVVQELEETGDPNAITGLNYLRGPSRQFVRLNGNNDGYGFDVKYRIYIEKGLIKSTRSSGVIISVMIGAAPSDKEADKRVDVAMCTRVTP